MEKELVLGKPTLKGRHSREQEGEQARNEGGPRLTGRVYIHVGQQLGTQAAQQGQPACLAAAS